MRLMSVKRRTMLSSASWKTSTRLRPRSLAALQAVSAAAKACTNSCARGSMAATPMLIETASVPSPMRGAELLGALAQRFGEAGRIVQPDRQQHREAIAGDARRDRARGQALADQLAQLRDDLVAHVHAVVVVDHVHAIDVDRQRAPPALRAAGRGCRRAVHALLEGRAVQQAGECVVAAGDHGGHAPRQQLGEPRLVRREFGHRSAAETAPARRWRAVGARDRAGQNPIGVGRVAGLELHAG